MSLTEYLLITPLVVWALASLLFVCRVPRLQRWIARWNRGQVLAHWTLFSTRAVGQRPGVFEVRYRDRDDVGGVSPWRLGTSGHAWSWRAFVWFPRRFLANAVQHLGREVRLLRHREPDGNSADEVMAILRAEVNRMSPVREGCVREFRLVRVSSRGVEETVVARPPATGTPNDD